MFVSVHLLQRVHVDRDGDDRVLAAHLHHDRALRPGLVRNREETARARSSSGRKESEQQEVRLEVGQSD